ncbi:predicted protein [Nematostella vectensis]|uniref:Protein kinase domain-containing protein n=1 Tax=Nematostella vectensis TaxID=45351 RepID=A7SZ02_NEMVE|nr:predicted protein [Nematostella vectensis]|eukprot:XP_001623163.1 predicted protein [Nematostella vectensis]
MAAPRAMKILVNSNRLQCFSPCYGADIKTCNILLGESSSQAYIVKLGYFSATNYEFRQFSALTTLCFLEAKTVIGTAAYTAQELLERGAMPDIGSDVYSFSMVLVEFAKPSRSAPWQGDASNIALAYRDSKL